MPRSPLRNVNNMLQALLLLLLAGVGPGGVSGQLAAKPTRGPHPSSPCPSVFSYEGREPEKNRWYGVVLVSTDEALDGLRLNVRLTHRAQILGNFIGDVSTSDNVEFTILNLKMRLTPGPPLPVRIFAAFGDRDDIPYIANIKLNGRTICGNVHPEQSTDTAARLTTTPATSLVRPSKPLSRPSGGGSGGSAGIAAGHQFEEEPRPRPPPPATPRPTPAAPRPTTTPRSSPVYEQTPDVNPDNYYPPSNSVNNVSPAFNGNQYETSSKRPARPETRPDPRPDPRPDEEVYRPAPNYTSSTDADRGIYRPSAAKHPATTERHQRPAERPTDRPADRPADRPVGTPVYMPPKYSTSTERSYSSSKYVPTTEAEPVRDAYQPPRTTAPPRSAARPASVPDTRPPAREEPRPQPQPWPTSNYDEPAAAPPQSGPSTSPKSRPARSTCGTIAPPATPLIINGETSIPGKWPWHVALYKPHGRDWKYQCGGSLVSPTVVVTAAHCVTTSVGRPVGPESLLVFLGKHALRTTSEDGVQDKHVYFIHVHPGYNYTNYRNDIAVLILSSPATITPAVRPVCLWDKERSDLSHVEGKFGTVVGWGIETDGLLTEELHQALMPVVSPAICIYSYPSFFGVYTNNQTYCAGYSPDQPAAGTSVCNGDSGGGMFFKRDEDVPDDEAVWMLRGLVSLSVRTKQDRCDPSHFVVFTDVAKYGDWLENFLAP